MGSETVGTGGGLFDKGDILAARWDSWNTLDFVVSNADKSDIRWWILTHFTNDILSLVAFAFAARAVEEIEEMGDRGLMLQIEARRGTLATSCTFREIVSGQNSPFISEIGGMGCEVPAWS